MLLILTAAVVSFDIFAVGVSYGLSGIEFPPKSIFVMNFTAFVIILAATLAGRFTGMVLDGIWCELLSGLMITGLGIWMIVQGCRGEKEENLPCAIITNPAAADIDKSKTIESFEAFVIGVAVSIDATVVCFGVSAEGKNNGFVFPLIVLATQIIFAISGLIVGKKIGKNLKINSKKVAFVSGGIIIMLGFHGLCGLF